MFVLMRLHAQPPVRRVPEQYPLLLLLSGYQRALKDGRYTRRRASTGWAVRWGLLAVFLILPSIARTESYDESVSKGSSFLREGKLQQAVDQFQLAYQVKPVPDVALQIGRIYLRLQQSDAALRFCKVYVDSHVGRDSADDRQAKALDCLRQAREQRKSAKAVTSKAVTSKAAVAHRPHAPNGPVKTASAPSAEVSHPATSAAVPPAPNPDVQSPVPAATTTQAAVTTAPPTAHVTEFPELQTAIPDVAPAQRRIPYDNLPLSPEPSTSPVGSTSTPSDVVTNRPLYKRWWVWSLVGLGVSAAVTATVAGIMASRSSSDTGTDSINHQPEDPLVGVDPVNRRKVTFPTRLGFTWFF